jgi:hypothetical protein
MEFVSAVCGAEYDFSDSELFDALVSKLLEAYPFETVKTAVIGQNCEPLTASFVREGLKKPIAVIEKEIAASKSAVGPDYPEALRLYKATEESVLALRELSVFSSALSGITLDSLAQQLLQCISQYYRHTHESEAFAKTKEFLLRIKSIPSSGAVKDEWQQNYDALLNSPRAGRIAIALGKLEISEKSISDMDAFLAEAEGELAYFKNNGGNTGSKEYRDAVRLFVRGAANFMIERLKQSADSRPSLLRSEQEYACSLFSSFLQKDLDSDTRLWIQRHYNSIHNKIHPGFGKIVLRIFLQLIAGIFILIYWIRNLVIGAFGFIIIAAIFYAVISKW